MQMDNENLHYFIDKTLPGSESQDKNRYVNNRRNR